MRSARGRVVSTVARFAGQAQTSVVRAAPVPDCAGCSRNPPTRVPTILTHEMWPANYWESLHASRGKPLAHSHGTSTSPTTGDLTIPSRALDRRGIRRSGVSPADSLNGYRELFSIHGRATVAGASWFNCRLAAIAMHLPAATTTV